MDETECGRKLDRILLHGISFRGRHGALPEERVTGGHFTVDLVIFAALAEAGAADDLSRTVDYGEIFRRVRTLGEEERYDLLEALAERMARSILELNRVIGVRLVVKKHHPPVNGIIDYAGVEIERWNK